MDINFRLLRSRALFKFNSNKNIIQFGVCRHFSKCVARIIISFRSWSTAIPFSFATDAFGEKKKRRQPQPLAANSFRFAVKTFFDLIKNNIKVARLDHISIVIVAGRGHCCHRISISPSHPAYSHSPFCLMCI